MHERFEQLAQRVATEGEGDEGLKISNETESAYRALLSMYDDAVGSEFEDEFDNDLRLGCVRRFIGDIPRTVYMTRAVARSIADLEEGGAHEILIAEAGSGTGLLAAIALALSKRVRVVGFDLQESRVAVSERFANLLGYGPRAHFQQRNLLRAPFTERLDLLIAEHISCGLAAEDAVNIPRTFTGVDPRRVIPYSVTPVVVGGLELVTKRDKDGVSFSYRQLGGANVEVLSGRDVVLADRFGSDQFSVEGQLTVRPGLSPLLVGNDIDWCPPGIRPCALRQTVEGIVSDPDFTVEAGTDPKNHLLKPALVRSADIPLDGRWKYAALESRGQGVARVGIGLSYPIGNQTVTNFGKVKPPLITTNHPDVSVTYKTYDALTAEIL